jgi:hypothetical protein
MLSMSAKLPVSDEMRRWADDAFQQLSKLLGRKRMLDAAVVLPEDKFFPEPYDGSKLAVRALADRVAGYMGIRPETYVVEIYAANEQALRTSIPFWSGKTQDAAGLYFHEQEDGRYLIGLHASQLKEPLSIVATLAHELSHVILLGEGLIDRRREDMEPLTDLCTVYLGMGVFTASVAFQFKQWNDTDKQGWSTTRKGYLSEPMWGYALARFARERKEENPAWASSLPPNVRAYFKRSARWLEKNVTPTTI